MAVEEGANTSSLFASVRPSKTGNSSLATLSDLMVVESSGTECGRFIATPTRQLSVRAGDGQGFGRCRARKGVTNVLTTSGELARDDMRDWEQGVQKD